MGGGERVPMISVASPFPDRTKACPWPTHRARSEWQRIPTTSMLRQGTIRSRFVGRSIAFIMPGRFEASRYWRAGMLAAVAGHVLVGALVLAWPLLILAWSGVPQVEAKPKPITFEARTSPESDRPAAMLPTSDEAPGQSIAEYVEQRIEQVQRETEAADTEDSLKRLQQLSGQLQQASSAESVKQLSGQLNRWLGNSARASAPPTEKPEGPFDYSTAQLHDVLRKETAAGQFEYRSVLIDSAGRTIEVPTSEEEGARLYRIWELIKKNPLLETVYRQVVMGLLDSLTKDAANRP